MARKEAQLQEVWKVINLDTDNPVDSGYYEVSAYKTDAEGNVTPYVSHAYWNARLKHWRGYGKSKNIYAWRSLVPCKLPEKYRSGKNA